MSLFYYPNVDPIYLYQRAEGQYLPINQTITVKNNKVTLREIPDFVTKVAVTKSDSTVLTEVTSAELLANQYRVDYTNGMVFFHADLEGQSLTFVYLGTGQVNIGANRIIIDTDPENQVGVTVQDVLDTQANIHADLTQTLDLINTNQVVKQDEYTTYKNSVDTQLAQKKNQIESSKVTQVEPLHIKTFNGTDEPLHPSVYYNESGWNGAKFWMAYSPFPMGTGTAAYIDRWECPCIVKSDDGIEWKLPLGAPDPLIDLTEAEIVNRDYFSDPCIVMNGTTMEVWFRKTNGANTNITDIYRITSTDGITWTAPVKVYDSQNANNGIGVNKSMRSQQVFYDGAKYTSFYGLQGGSGFWKAETTNPSSGVWSSVQLMSFINSPLNMAIWHIGMYKEGNVYHLTGYDATNNAIQYFTSSDGVNFQFIDTILKSDENTELTTYFSLYQTVPVKSKNDWLLYSSGTFKASGISKRGISLYKGKNLNELIAVNGGLIKRRLLIDRSPTLINNYSDNSLTQKYYGTYSDYKRNRFSGYRMNFGTNIHAPAWLDQDKSRPIIYVFDDTVPPSITPEHVGIVHRNINTKEIWISVGTSSISDWKKIKVDGSVINTQRTNITAASSLDVTSVYRLVINAGVATTITNLTGVVDGQELWILNVTPYQMTLQHGGTGSGNMKFKDGANIVLDQWESVSLIAVSSTWYQK